MVDDGAVDDDCSRTAAVHVDGVDEAEFQKNRSHFINIQPK